MPTSRFLRYIKGMSFLLLVSFLCGYVLIDRDSIKERDQSTPQSVRDADWDISEVYLDRATSLWYAKADSSPVDGYITRYFPNGQLAEKFGVIEGEKWGVQWTYYPDGHPKFMDTYSHNRLNGKLIRWGEDKAHPILAQLNYQEGKLHGLQKKWYDTGEIHKIMNLNEGKEDGLQQAFRKNGALYANYEARNGRTFGLKRSNLCYEVVDQKINNEK